MRRLAQLRQLGGLLPRDLHLARRLLLLLLLLLAQALLLLDAVLR